MTGAVQLRDEIVRTSLAQIVPAYEDGDDNSHNAADCQQDQYECPQPREHLGCTRSLNLLGGVVFKTAVIRPHQVFVVNGNFSNVTISQLPYAGESRGLGNTHDLRPLHTSIHSLDRIAAGDGTKALPKIWRRRDDTEIACPHSREWRRRCVQWSARGFASAGIRLPCLREVQPGRNHAAAPAGWLSRRTTAMSVFAMLRSGPTLTPVSSKILSARAWETRGSSFAMRPICSPLHPTRRPNSCLVQLTRPVSGSVRASQSVRVI